MNIEDMLAGMRDHERAEPAILPEAAVARLRERAEAYRRSLIDNPFNVGDLVTPRGDSDCGARGQAHVVVETRRAAAIELNGIDVGSNSYGSRADTRILVLINRKISAFWVESWQFEPWKEPTP